MPIDLLVGWWVKFRSFPFLSSPPLSIQGEGGEESVVV